MTQEEKAIAYDEAVNKLRRFMEQGIDPLITRADVQDFFPELAESEDEKVRKWCISHFKECINVIKDNDEYKEYLSNKVLAWLEKQGEQKPQRMISAEAKEAMYDKPADTVEPKFKVGDKIYLKPEYRMPDDDTPIANTVKEIRRIDDKHYRFDGSYIFIEDQDKYALAEQNPAWSEEDENKLNSCIDAIKACYKWDNMVNWLRSFKDRVQPQNRWKPSELQLGCLSDAIEHYNSLGYPASKLKELLNDLKELKGEV